MKPPIDPAARAVLEIRTTKGQKGRWKLAAGKDRLGKWAADTLDKAAKKGVGVESESRPARAE
jgi:hypothetical protein